METGVTERRRRKREVQTRPQRLEKEHETEGSEEVVAAVYTRALGLLFDVMVSEGRGMTEWRPATTAYRGGLPESKPEVWTDRDPTGDDHPRMELYG